jgi:hypothetical protein
LAARVCAQVESVEQLLGNEKANALNVDAAKSRLKQAKKAAKRLKRVATQKIQKAVSSRQEEAEARAFAEDLQRGRVAAVRVTAALRRKARCEHEAALAKSAAEEAVVAADAANAGKVEAKKAASDVWDEFVHSKAATDAAKSTADAAFARLRASQEATSRAVALIPSME